MKIGLINGTPKFKESASRCLMNDLATYLGQHQIIKLEAHRNAFADDQLEEIRTSDALVFFFPLYVFGIPSHLLSCLTQLETYFKQYPSKATIYGVCNNGFYEGSENQQALMILKNWSERCGLSWGQGIGFGAGGIILSTTKVPLGKGPKKNLGKAFKELSQNILHLQTSPNIYTQANFPRFLYKLMAEMNWRREAKKNGLKPSELGKAY